MKPKTELTMKTVSFLHSTQVQKQISTFNMAFTILIKKTFCIKIKRKLNHIRSADINGQFCLSGNKVVELNLDSPTSNECTEPLINKC